MAGRLMETVPSVDMLAHAVRAMAVMTIAKCAVIAGHIMKVAARMSGGRIIRPLRGSVASRERQCADDRRDDGRSEMCMGAYSHFALLLLLPSCRSEKSAN